MAGLRASFADKLRLLVGKEVSIAHVCRALDINRQQFNRYLSGEALPNEQNLGKIAAYFQLAEDELFSTAYERGPEAASSAADPFMESLARVFKGETKCLTDGPYFIYFPSNVETNKCMRGLVTVKRKNATTRFNALIRLRLEGAAPGQSSVMRYTGLVRELDGSLLFLGQVRGGPEDIFLLSLDPIHLSRKGLFAGLAIPARADGNSARRVALQRQRNEQNLCALGRKCGLLDIDGPDIDPWVRAAISADAETGPAILWPRGLASIMRG